VYSESLAGIGIVEMLFSTSLVVFVGGGDRVSAACSRHDRSPARLCVLFALHAGEPCCAVPICSTALHFVWECIVGRVVA
jgi:hypothetical protein